MAGPANNRYLQNAGCWAIWEQPELLPSVLTQLVLDGNLHQASFQKKEQTGVMTANRLN